MQRRDFIRRSVFAACVTAGHGMLSAEATSVTLRRSRGGTLTSLDPHRGISATDMEINADLFVGLTAVDARGQIVPGLASDWTISADGRRYIRGRIHHRNGSEGDPIHIQRLPIRHSYCLKYNYVSLKKA